ncbi:arylsulfatase [Bacteroidota bacterium]
MKSFYTLLALTIGVVSCNTQVDKDQAKTTANQQQKNRPNVILVITDDQGYGELSCHGNPILETPQLDRLHSQSLRLTDYHVAPMCTPTRGQLLTGLDAARNGSINVSSGRTLLRPELPTIADIFSENGYNTGIFGKWHLGDNYPFRPQDRGFDETLWFPSSHVGSVPDYWGNNYNDDTYIHNGKREKYEGYCTDIFFNSAMEWMNTSIKEGEPFLTYLPTNTPHWPHIAPPEDVEVIEAAIAESEFTDLNVNLKRELTGYLAMIRNIDTNMGRLEEFLKTKGIRENTVLIFTTDNGSTFGPQYYNAGMRGRKTQLWEGGHRVPCFIRWPEGNLSDPHDIAGLTQVQDLLPTLIDLCNLQVSGDRKFDGISLAPTLRSNTDAPEDRMLIINYSRMPIGFDFPSPVAPSIMQREGAGVLWKKWRFLRDNELYDFESDPLQQENVIDKHREIVEKMRNHLDSWWDDVKDNANDPQRVVVGNEKENPMMITSCEWLDVFVDMQVQIHRGDLKNGYWLLHVDQPGDYEFELRRWPRESDIALMDKEDDDTALPIAAGRIFIGGVSGETDGSQAFGFQGERKKVQPGDKAVTFSMELKPGPITLHTWFEDDKDQPICGAYYVYIKRK